MSIEEQEIQPELLADEWGRRLTAIRESRSVSIEQAANDLNLPAEYIRCLEEGRVEGLPSMVFAKGYIRTYLRFLDVENIDDQISEFVSIHGESTNKDTIRPVSRVRQQVKVGDPLMKLFTWGVVLALLGVSIWWWQAQNGGAENSDIVTNVGAMGEVSLASDSAEDMVVLEDGTATLALPVLDDRPIDGVVESEGENLQGDIASEAEPESLSVEEINQLKQALGEQREVLEVDSSQTLFADGEITVVADFIAECWVSIKDADGKSLFNNLRGKGQRVNVTGKAPLTVLIGAADAVSEFKYNGEALDLAPFSNKNVVRLNLPLSE